MFEPISASLSLISSFAIIGFFLAACYEIIRIIRLFKKQSDLAVSITDFLFLSFAGLVAFAYSMELGNGRFRWFYIAGMLFGAAVYFLTIGRLVSLASNLIVRFVKHMLSFAVKCTKRALAILIEYILLPIHRKICVFLQFLKGKIGNIYVFLRKKALNSSNHLKNRAKMLYNERTERKADLKRAAIPVKTIAGDKRNVIQGKTRNAANTKSTFRQIRKT